MLCILEFIFVFCSRYLIAGSDEFYTSDWPQSYDSGSTFDCKINIREDGIKKIIFMDLNLRENYFGQCNKYHFLS